jgi:2-methylcitrate dehydratase PrpD
MWAAQFSVPYAVAQAILKVEPGPAWFGPGALRNERVRGLAAKVVVEARDDAHKPSGFHAATAILQTKQGEIFSATIKVAKGEYAAPMSDAEVTRKALRLVADGDPTGIAAGLIELPLETRVGRYLIDIGSHAIAP